MVTDIDGGVGPIDYFGNNMYETYAGPDPETAAGSNNTTNVPDPLGGGLNLAAGFQTDIDDQTRTAPWDIGADEESIAPAKPTIVRWYEVEPWWPRDDSGRGGVLSGNPPRGRSPRSPELPVGLPVDMSAAFD